MPWSSAMECCTVVFFMGLLPMSFYLVMHCSSDAHKCARVSVRERLIRFQMREGDSTVFFLYLVHTDLIECKGFAAASAAVSI